MKEGIHRALEDATEDEVIETLFRTLFSAPNSILVPVLMKLMNAPNGPCECPVCVAGRQRHVEGMH